MKALGKIFLTILLLFFALVVQANNRPTIQFDGKSYYLASTYNEIDQNFSPINVVELYYPVGENSDNFTSSIKRITFLEVLDFRASAVARLSEFKQDNPNIPYEVMQGSDGKRITLRVSFWWPFRPIAVTKQVYVYQMDPEAHRSMCYIVTQMQFFDLSKTTNESLKKQGKDLLIPDNIAKQAKDLNF
jgi:hypothetical protein